MPRRLKLWLPHGSWDSGRGPRGTSSSGAKCTRALAQSSTITVIKLNQNCRIWKRAGSSRWQGCHSILVGHSPSFAANGWGGGLCSHSQCRGRASMSRAVDHQAHLQPVDGHQLPRRVVPLRQHHNPHPKKSLGIGPPMLLSTKFQQSRDKVLNHASIEFQILFHLPFHAAAASTRRMESSHYNKLT